MTVLLTINGTEYDMSSTKNAALFHGTKTPVIYFDGETFLGRAVVISKPVPTRADNLAAARAQNNLQ